MENLNNISELIANGIGKRSSKHNVEVSDGNILIKSSTLGEVSLDVELLQENLSSVEIARQLVRGIAKKQGVKYNSSLQNVADKMFNILESI